MAAAVPENKSLQDRINALHIQLKEANEEKEKPSLPLGLENDNYKKPRPGIQDEHSFLFFMGNLSYFFLLFSTKKTRLVFVLYEFFTNLALTLKLNLLTEDTENNTFRNSVTALFPSLSQK